MDLQENIKRIKEVMGILKDEQKSYKLFEAKSKININDKIVILLDGTSSSGKTYMSSGLKKKGWVIISSDDMGKIENRVPFDHKGDGFDKKAGQEFQKETQKYRKNKEKNFWFDSTWVSWSGHPKYKEYKKVGKDPRSWYIFQNIKYGLGEDSDKIIIDDISDTILGYYPNCIYILLYTPIDVLKKNVIERFNKGDSRGEWVFSEQFLSRYKATENENESICMGQENSFTKIELKELLSDKKLQKSYNDGKKLNVSQFIKKLGVVKDGVKYWIKLKNPLKKGHKLFVSKGKTPKDLEEFIEKEILLK